MKIVIYGGSFNPPHCGHVEAAMTISEQLKPDKLLIIPANIPPHKELAEGSPDAHERLLLTQLAFSDMPNVEVSDIELHREGKSYTASTVELLMQQYPDAELYLAMGTDMLLSFAEWHSFSFLLETLTLPVFVRRAGAAAQPLRHEPKSMSSRDIRDMLCRRMGASFLPEKVYERIIANGAYDAKPELSWLRKKAYARLKPNRVAHVVGCESEAVKLAQRWGEDPEDAAEAGILHDITKKLSLQEQLILCDKYGIINDTIEEHNVKLLHAKTGAAMAKRLFNVSKEVYEAIRWHTTGKPDMTLLEKIIYMADYIEPNRDFEGVEKLRTLAYENLDAAMALGLKMSLEDIRSYGQEPYIASVEAYEWYKHFEQ